MSEPTRFCSSVSDAKNSSTAISPIAAPTVRVNFMGSSLELPDAAQEQRTCPADRSGRKSLRTQWIARASRLDAGLPHITVLRVADDIVIARLRGLRT